MASQTAFSESMHCPNLGSLGRLASLNETCRKRVLGLELGAAGLKEAGTFGKPSAGIIQCPQADIDAAVSVRSASAVETGQASLIP